MASSRVDACTLAGGTITSCALPPPHAQRSAVEAASQASATPVTRIGTIEALPGIRGSAPRASACSSAGPVLTTLPNAHAPFF